MRDESENTPEIPSNSSFVGYEKLQELLAAGKWKEANEETRIAMLKVAGRTKQGYFEVENIKSFPSQDLYIIDQLWITYSKNHFGFSVQKRIWQDVHQDWHEFGICVKWKELNEWQVFKWISKDDLTFNLKVSQGHLPAVFPCITQSSGFSANIVWSLLSRQDL
ncbi:GUN4 domain-containing protein [Nostoc sp. CCY 9925]|uniref:GUN4 domain-containing protein n=1 Tax=Nostoc sp. CCY 9925 TaxID=3103865 RepID=UPI0039C65C08